MNCQACGHDVFMHNDHLALDAEALCAVCYMEPHGGPCFPWEFR